MKKTGIALLLITGLSLAGLPAHADDGPARGELVGVYTPVKFDVSPPLRSIEPKTAVPLFFEDVDPESDVNIPGPQDTDLAVQTTVGEGDIPTTSVSFDMFNGNGYLPPDPVGAAGPSHYVVMSNVRFAIYDKSGSVLYGPANNNTLWSGFGGPCQTSNSGDPIVVYDQLADRFMLTQFTTSGPPYYQCVAVSATPDPTGSYYRYAFDATKFGDYPKYGVWPDGYYIATRETSGAESAGIYATERAEMLVGNPAAQMVYFRVTTSTAPRYTYGHGLLPANLDGYWPPPAGSPEYFLGTQDNGGGLGAPSDAINLWEFRVDWTTPSNSTFTLANTLPTAPFDSLFPCSPGSRDCIPQPGTTTKIDFLNRQRPLWRLAYRNLGGYEALVANQSVEAAPSIAGVRWYEVRDPGGTPTIYQQGTYAPGTTDGIHRWLGSIAQDKSGNIALGFSASDGTSTYPSIWYTGRLVTDALGTMPQGEGTVVDGLGSQTGGQRWGDYSSLNVDPVDDCTFWYVSEYYPVTHAWRWRLRTGAFKFTQCNCAPITISPGTLPNANESTPYNQTITASGGTAPYSFAVSTGSLPPGLSLSLAGTLSGTPTTIGTYDFTVSTRDSTGCGTVQAYSLTVDPFTATANVNLVTGPGPGTANSPRVLGFDTAGAPNGRTDFLAYGAGGYGVNVDLANFRNTIAPVSDILTGPGPGDVYGPQVRGYTVDSGAIQKVNFYAYGTLRFGANVNAGDFDGDGYEEILSGAGPGAVFGPHVRGWNFDGNQLSSIQKINFFAYNTLRYGVQVAGAALDADNFAEILTGPGAGVVFGAQVRGFNYDGTGVSGIAGINFTPYSTRYGVHVTGGGDVDGDAFDEILTAPGPDPAATPNVRGFNWDGGPLSGIAALNFTAGATFYGATLDAMDLEDDGFAEMVVGVGYDPTGGARLQGFDYDGTAVSPIAALDFNAYTGTTYGVNVAVDEVGP